MLEMLVVTAFVAGYFAIILEQRIRVNKTASAILTAVACWVLLALKVSMVPGENALGGVEGHLLLGLQGSAQIVFFIIGAMTIVQLMEAHGAFQVVIGMIRTRDRRMLLSVVSLITFFLSSVLDNLTTAIVMVSLVHRLISDKDDRLVFGSMIIIAANAGGAWSPIGDVTTTMLWIGGQVSSVKIISRLFFPSLISMLVPLAWFLCLMKKGPATLPQESFGKSLAGSRLIFFLGLGSLIFVPVFRSMTGLPPFLGMLLGLGILWLVTDLMHGNEQEHLKVHKVLSLVDFSSAFFFLGILLAVSALEAGGLLQSLASWMDQVFHNKNIICFKISMHYFAFVQS